MKFNIPLLKTDRANLQTINKNIRAVINVINKLDIIYTTLYITEGTFFLSMHAIFEKKIPLYPIFKDNHPIFEFRH